jgi:hypothetical protein
MPRHCCWRKRIGFALLTLIVSTMSGAQTAILESTKPTITIQRVNHPPKLEDFLNMKPSASAPPMTKVNNFIQRDPKDGAPAQQKNRRLPRLRREEFLRNLHLLRRGLVPDPRPHDPS